MNDGAYSVTSDPGEFLQISRVPAVPQHLCNLSSLVCCVKAARSAFSRFSGRINLYVDVYLVCLWEAVSSGSSYATILDNPNPHNI